ncbi:MAG: hypothetical protein ACREDF_02310, partial [Thermoplasmata archaeon]
HEERVHVLRVLGAALLYDEERIRPLEVRHGKSLRSAPVPATDENGVRTFPTCRPWEPKEPADDSREAI